MGIRLFNPNTPVTGAHSTIRIKSKIDGTSLNDDFYAEDMSVTANEFTVAVGLTSYTPHTAFDVSVTQGGTHSEGGHVNLAVTSYSPSTTPVGDWEVTLLGFYWNRNEAPGSEAYN